MSTDMSEQTETRCLIVRLERGRSVLATLHRSDSGDAILDSWIFGGAARLVDCVWRGGVQRVAGGRHVAREAIDARYRAAMDKLLA